VSDLERVLEALEHSHVFLTGGAGVGKSYTTNELIRHYRREGEQVVPLGSTGVSAVNIGGFTLHSFFVFGISNSLEELASHDRRSKGRLSELKKVLKVTDLIVIDEISMVSSRMLDMIAYRLESSGYRGRVLFVGDFFQLPPIVKKQTHSHAGLFDEPLYAFESEAWYRMKPTVIELTEMKRTHDPEFTHILHKIRTGVCDSEVTEYLGGLQGAREFDAEPTILYGRNQEVEITNRAKLNLLESDETILFAETESTGAVNEKRLETWHNLLPVSKMLTIKEGAPVLFTVNKWGKFVNGERGVIRAIHDDYLVVEKKDEYVRVERHTFELLDMVSKDDGTIENVSLAKLSQFPVRLAYAVTIHKSQGMSIENLVCNIDNIFAPSQFYVALSRATDPEKLHLEYTKGPLEHYLRRIIHVHERVRDYYRGIG